MNTPSFLSEAVVYHDYRRRDAIDLSGNSNDGTLTAATFNRDGVDLLDDSSKITVADSAELRLEEMTLICFNHGGFNQEVDYFPRLIEGKGIEIYLRNADQININSVNTTTNATGKKCIGIYMKDGETADFYFDGLYSISSGAVAITATSDPLKIGNITSARQLREGFSAMLMFPRELTATEHAELYGYLESLKFPSKTNAKIKQSDPNIVVDGNMEAVGTTAWTAGNDATLLKLATTSPGGEQYLIIRNSGTPNAQANQDVLTTGNTYRVSGWGRGDLAAVPRISSGGSTFHWTGTNSSSWQYFDVEFKAESATFSLEGFTGTNTKLVGFDSIKVAEVGKTYLESWKTDWAANVSDANVTSGFLENTPFTVASGAFKIVSDTHNGSDIKAIECITAGVVYMKASDFGQTSTEAIAGEYSIYIRKTEASNITIGLMFQNPTLDYNAAGQNGYGFRITSGERYVYFKTVDGSASNLTQGNPPTSGFLPNVYQCVQIKRTTAGVAFSYLEGELITDIEAGANPTAADTTFTTCEYMQFALNAGDKISLSGISGNRSFTKKLI